MGKPGLLGIAPGPTTDGQRRRTYDTDTTHYSYLLFIIRQETCPTWRVEAWSSHIMHPVEHATGGQTRDAHESKSTDAAITS